MLQTTPPQHAAIEAFGAYRPARVVTNDELATRVDTSDEWITTRVGIKERRYAAAHETVVSMAVEAGRDALGKAGVAGGEVDLLIVATCTAPSQLPSAAPQVAHLLGASAPGAYDVNAACAGFCYSLAQASHAIQAGAAQKALVIGVEKLTDWIDHDDRTTSIIFADGAGAAVVGRSGAQGIGPTVWGSAGDRPEAIIIRSRDQLLEMDGRAVFRWATTEVRAEVDRICGASGLSLRDIDIFVPHQANMRIIDNMLRALDFRDDVVVARDIALAGNTSAASIPLAIDTLLDAGQATSGDKVLTIGFGAGLTFAGQVFEMP
ncbi:beta-ketoacyl-ACP synthase III [Blastococcus sp. Marseille-P5729]|uniref:beta-ketoacyl-ACP synthase III n=1 Tax=Blastococcus sp. Marseille-P5729 TaxID=2086582 RepID=UPI000D0E3994|nr:beta-ketoacyl-ACP synthase III [Blastococcus sp. Marseille-P5729]